MSKVLITRSKLDNLAVAVSAKSGATLPLTIAQMQTAVENIPTGGTLITKNITANGTYDAEDDNADGYSSVTVAVPGSTPSLQTLTKSYTPSETAQSETVTADSGYDGIDTVSVSVGAISSTYVGTGITRRSSSDLTASGATVTVPSGYYSAQATKSVSTTTHPDPSVSISTTTGLITASHTQTAGYVSAGTTTDTLQLSTQSATTITPSTSAQTAVSAGKYTTGAVTVAAMPSGTAGTPTASKGTVSNHSVSVTPSVTNTTGYITGSTKTGTAVTVSASELVSGSQNITTNNTYDVTNLASVVVNVSSSSKNIQIDNEYKQRTANSYGDTGLTLTVAKTGTYKVTWTAWRGSSSGTMGTNLHVNSTTGTNQQTWTGTYGQLITLTNQSYTQGDVLKLYATSGSNSRSVYVSNLMIIEQ